MTIEINDLSEYVDAHLIEMRDTIMLEHGGIVTRMEFDKVEAMPLDTFKKQVLQGMRPDEDSFMVVKDAAASVYTLMTGDQALRYHLVTVGECSLADVINQLRSTKMNEDIIHNMPFPMVRERGTSLGTRYTAAFPEQRRDYKYRDKQYKIWIPRHWFGIEVDHGGRVTKNMLCVCPSWNPEFNDTVLYHWPLGNVYPNGKVCTGKSEVEAVIDARQMSTADMLIQNHERVMNMAGNDDLIMDRGDGYYRALDAYWETLKRQGKLTELEMPKVYCDVAKRTLEILSTREGMQNFPYSKMETSPEDFT